MQQQPAADGNRSQGTALSLKARETASLSLKRIFEQHLQNFHTNDDSHQHHLDLDLRLAAAPSTSITNNFTDFTQQHLPHVHSSNRSVNAEMGNTSTSKVSQLTVFYAGKVCIFEDVPADKAKAIMLLASGSARMSYNAVCKSRPTTPNIISSRPLKPHRRSQAELPFARKASLARFLEKRKDRVEIKATQAEIKSAKDGDISTESPQKRLCTKPSLPSTKL